MKISTSPLQMMKRESPGSPQRKINSPAGIVIHDKRSAKSSRSSALRNSNNSTPFGSLALICDLPFFVLALHFLCDVVQTFDDEFGFFAGSIGGEGKNAVSDSFVHQGRGQPARFFESFAKLGIDGDAPADVGGGELLQEQASAAIELEADREAANAINDVGFGNVRLVEESGLLNADFHRIIAQHGDSFLMAGIVRAGFEVQAQDGSKFFFFVFLLSFGRSLAAGSQKQHDHRAEQEIDIEPLRLNHHSDIKNRKDLAK